MRNAVGARRFRRRFVPFACAGVAIGMLALAACDGVPARRRRLGRRAALIDPSTHSMEDAVAIMTGARAA